jgi:hypothetical protein
MNSLVLVYQTCSKLVVSVVADLTGELERVASDDREIIKPFEAKLPNQVEFVLSIQSIRWMNTPQFVGTVFWLM